MKPYTDFPNDSTHIHVKSLLKLAYLSEH